MKASNLFFTLGKIIGMTSTERRYSTQVFDSTQKSSVAIIGSGAVGSYYGARLHEAGHNVTFLMRNEHFAHCTKEGLKIKSVDGDIYIPPNELNVVSDVKNIGIVDWVIVSLKSSSLDILPELISPVLNQNTRILTIMNGLIDDEVVDLLKQYPYSAIYGGMAFICSNRLSPGHIDHSFYGSLNGGVASLSESCKEEKHVALERLKELWSDTKVHFTSVPSLLRGRWQKNCWNLPFSGISVAMNGISVDKIVSDEGLRKLADLIMDETIAIANADLESCATDPSLLLGEAEVSDSHRNIWFIIFYNPYIYIITFSIFRKSRCGTSLIQWVLTNHQL